ncbi:xanthine dehydrogenase accessory factor [Tistlia consotensis]|uniref:Xanthine dehydrogenase accessory factor n=1 Tax=Tistlia consotensis USBA 355 TaxID=560819 RepID=A0A1Y6BV81_9PROT|nr:XdhC family protein [Tistlia consotensis]SMF20404.1 xanthine dehydrogenase accessory factor [Tistlia consotensis USBA 355]SNR47927.1 xanthine dehydrogenase accessory factor [Tistlia consotensis]
MKREILDRLLEGQKAKRPLALVTDLESGRQLLLDGGETLGELAGDAAAEAAAARALDSEKSGRLPESSLFVQVFMPPLRLVVVGAVHIAQALVPMASLAGYDVTVIDPRQAWASDARFPDVKIADGWPDEALEALAPDRRTAVVTLTHDPKLDDPALITALNGPAFYIAALGSTRTHAKRRERLLAAGLGEAQIARIAAPAGLAIGARSPAEIAVSILAQMTAALRGAPPLVKAAPPQPAREGAPA